MIGKDISALANSATYRGKDNAYMIWGVDDITHEIKGTDYNRFSKLNGNQEIESWLRNSLSKNADFEFEDLELEGNKPCCQFNRCGICKKSYDNPQILQ